MAAMIDPIDDVGFDEEGDLDGLIPRRPKIYRERLTPLDDLDDIEIYKRYRFDRLAFCV